MAHRAQIEFCEKIRNRFPERFRWRRVLDCGSLDVNGSNRTLFQNCAYTGVDVGAGRNVDIVSPTHALEFPDSSFDVIVSSECFEHDMHFEGSLRSIVRLLAPGGLFFFTCATTGREEHGTRLRDPASSPLTASTTDWCDYYRNVTEQDVRGAIDVDRIFEQYEFEVDSVAHDLYFWGVKRLHEHA